MPGIPARSTPMFVWLDLYSNVDYPHPTGQRAFLCSDGRHGRRVPSIRLSPRGFCSESKMRRLSCNVQSRTDFVSAECTTALACRFAGDAEQAGADGPLVLPA